MRKRRAADRDCAVPAQSTTYQGERTTMNFLTDLLAGIVHFVGWLV
ncbi:hypothetical protein ACWD01_24040 [Streptomyces sp. NPDC002835]